MNKYALCFAAAFFLTILPSSTTARADVPGPNCGSDGCTKPGLVVLLPGNPDVPGPNCGSDGCTKPGFATVLK